jgi:hypothetical protein
MCIAKLTNQPMTKADESVCICVFMYVLWHTHAEPPMEHQHGVLLSLLSNAAW